MSTAAVALVVSGLSFGISALTFYRNSTREQFKRERLACMRIVAARAVVLWDQILTLVFANVNHVPVDPYLTTSTQLNARRLEEVLDEAVGVGLLDLLVGDRPNGTSMHAAFRAELVWMAGLPEPSEAPLDEWTKSHGVMGMVRLLDVCLSFRPSVLPENIRADIEGKVNDLKSQAWTYLSAPADAKP